MDTPGSVTGTVGARRRGAARGLTIGLVFGLFGLGVACGRPIEAPPLPPGVLPESTMVRLQADIHVAEAELSLRRGEYAPSRLAWDTIFEGLLARYGTDTAEYRRSFLYYASNVERLDEIYRQVLDSLAARDR